jgi:hypothetical protein
MIPLLIVCAYLFTVLFALCNSYNTKYCTFVQVLFRVWSRLNLMTILAIPTTLILIFVSFGKGISK